MHAACQNVPTDMECLAAESPIKVHLFIVTKPSRPDLITIAIDHTTFVIA